MSGQIRVLSWNLYHGRDFPPDPALRTWRSRLLRITERNATHAQVNRSLLDEFSRVLDGFEWDIALLQEAPPRWFAELGRRTRSNGLRVLTSRNLCPPVQRLLADLNPDLIASSDGGSNQILVRAPAGSSSIAGSRSLGAPSSVACTGRASRSRTGRACAWPTSMPRPDCPARRASSSCGRPKAAVEWSAGDPLVFGGDLNVRPKRTPAPVRHPARALRPGRADRSRRHRPPAGARIARGRAAAAPAARAA